MQLLERRNALYQRSADRHHRLSESYKLQMFERDCDETKIWINEKLKAASDEGYLVRDVTEILLLISPTAIYMYGNCGIDCTCEYL